MKTSCGKFLNLAHYFPYNVKLRLLAHSRSFLANLKARNAIVGAENLLNIDNINFFLFNRFVMTFCLQVLVNVIIKVSIRVHTIYKGNCFPRSTIKTIFDRIVFIISHYIMS